MATCKFHRFQWKFQALGRKVLKALQLHEFQDHGLTLSIASNSETCVDEPPKVQIRNTKDLFSDDGVKSSISASPFDMPKVFQSAMKPMKHWHRWGPQTQLLSGNQSDNGFSATWGALVHIKDIHQLLDNRLPTSFLANRREKFCHNIFAASFDIWAFHGWST